MVQSIFGSLLYYARCIDNTLLPALNDIATSQTTPTGNTLAKCEQLLDYVSTYPHVALRFHASNMQLHVDSDAAYLVASKVRSLVAGFYYFKHNPHHQPFTHPNHPVLVECHCLRQAETAGLFHNAQQAILLRRILTTLGHPQAPTMIKTDNETACGFVNNNIYLRKSKMWYMRYYWLRDQEQKSIINIYWKRGKDPDDPNLADYPTKHHFILHHRGICPLYVMDI